MSFLFPLFFSLMVLCYNPCWVFLAMPRAGGSFQARDWTCTIAATWATVVTTARSLTHCCIRELLLCLFPNVQTWSICKKFPLIYDLLDFKKLCLKNILSSFGFLRSCVWIEDLYLVCWYNFHFKFFFFFNVEGKYQPMNRISLISGFFFFLSFCLFLNRSCGIWGFPG